MRKPSRKPGWQLDIARERIAILFKFAGMEFLTRPDRSHRYMELARKIAKRYNIKLQKIQKRKFCGHCGHYLKPGVNARSRHSNKMLLVTCLDCGHVSRFPYGA